MQINILYFNTVMSVFKVPAAVAEHKFHEKRKWRFDYAWPQLKIALEVEGGIYKRKGGKRCRFCGQTPQGRHNTVKGFLGDMEKYNMASMAGWTVIRTTPEKLLTKETADMVLAVINSK